MCDAKGVQFYQSAEKQLHGDIVMDGSNDAELFRQQCNCLHGCTETFYDFNVDRVKLSHSTTSPYHSFDEIPEKY